MARTCEICQKRMSTGYQISHSHIRTKRRWLPNLHRIRILVGGAPRRAYVCTRCVRSGRVQRAV